MIKKPTLLIDEKRCKKNIRKLISKARNNNILLRPHFKTHQSHLVGSWFKEEGVDIATVSSVSMAQHFAKDGWNDLTIAFPVNILELEEINGLAANMTLNLLVESGRVIQVLNHHIKNPVGVFLKIDVGYQRTGIHPRNTVLIDELLVAGRGSLSGSLEKAPGPGLGLARRLGDQKETSASFSSL